MRGSSTITIIDYGMGNLGSIRNMLKKLGVDAHVTFDPADIKIARKIILPGVGHFKRGMENIRSKGGLLEALNDAALQKKTPILGICLGAQLVTTRSDEGDVEGLNWIPAQTRKFELPAPYKIPHMGWREVAVKKQDHPLCLELHQPSRFYFVHSYFLKPDDESDTLMTATYGPVTFAAALQRGNIMACQFHPEKSHKFGMRILKNFSEMVSP